jgi:hypothetical protein
VHRIPHLSVIHYAYTSNLIDKMTTTHSEFNNKTEGIEVAEAFAGVIRGKTILVTGVNLGGIGFTTSEAFVSGIIS